MSRKKESHTLTPTNNAAEPARPAGELSQRELDQVSGGKVTLSDIKITKPIDKSTP